MIPPIGHAKLATGQAKIAAKRCEVEGRCVCGDIVIALDFPAFWAWHDHSSATRHAHGAAYATYVGAWKSRVRVLKGETKLARFENKKTGTARSFCKRCGTPIFYERPDALKWINMPRALFAGRTGREPRYHIGLAEAAEWEYRGEPLAPLKGFPGVMWARPRRKRLQLSMPPAAEVPLQAAACAADRGMDRDVSPARQAARRRRCGRDP